MKKYQMIQEPDYLFRIKALIDIPSIGVKAGDVGGYIESEHNLSQEGNGWIFDISVVKGNARVLSGIVRNQSTLSKNVTMEGGIIHSSTLEECIIRDGADIKNSNLLHVITNGIVVIEDSTIQNITFESNTYQEFKRVKLESKIVLTILERQKWEDVTLSVYRGIVKAPFTFKHSKFIMTTLFIYESATIENVVVMKEELVMKVGETIALNSHKSRNKRVHEIIGTSKDNPLLLHADNIKMSYGIIKGNPFIEGAIVLIHSKITDHANVSMNGVIKNSTISEYAEVQFERDEKKPYVFLEGIELSADAICDEDMDNLHLYKS